MRLGLSIDVEGRAPCPLEAEAVRLLLDQFDARQVRATFFFLGEFAAGHRDVVKSVARAGHEICVHGYRHISLKALNSHSLRADLVAVRNLVEDIIGDKIRGYRAPYASLTSRNMWAVDVIGQCGFEYDSSCFATRGPLLPSVVRSDGTWQFPNGLIEIPVGARRFGVFSLPIGGGFLRHFPYRTTLRLLKSQGWIGKSIVLYTHAHELIASPFGFGAAPSGTERQNLFLRLRRSPILQNRNCGKPHQVKVEALLADFECCALREFL